MPEPGSPEEGAIRTVFASGDPSEVIVAKLMLEAEPKRLGRHSGVDPTQSARRMMVPCGIVSQTPINAAPPVRNIEAR